MCADTPSEMPHDAQLDAAVPATRFAEMAFGYPRDFLNNHFVYLVISPRTQGLAIGVNVNPEPQCNLNCRFCETDLNTPARQTGFRVSRMISELKQTLELVRSGKLRQQPRYAKLPEDLLQFRHVALSGDGEPTLSEHFGEATEAVIKLRNGDQPFKLVLVSNSTTLDQQQVEWALALLSWSDEVWLKLDAGTQGYFEKVSGATLPLEKILANILRVASRRPVVIQSMFSTLDGEEPAENEIREYANRLKELKAAGANIALVQIYSVNRPVARGGCGHLRLNSLSKIAQTVRQISGLKTEVF